MNKLALIAILAMVAIFVGAIVGSMGTQPANPTKKGSLKTFDFTIDAGIGAELIKVTNVNVAASIKLTSADLPATFNCTENDVLTFNVTAKPGYAFNAWLLDDGTFQSKNPLTIKVTESFSMEAKFLTLIEEGESL